MRWYIGTSGWSYSSWRSEFFPADLPPSKWLSYYAAYFDAVEVNSSFYHLITSKQVENWQKAVPQGFTFTFKGSRFITHMKRLKEPKQPLARFMEALENQPKPSPVIFQLPGRFKKDLERLEGFLAMLPKGRRYAMEFRDPSWHDKDVWSLLHRYKVAFCLFEFGKLFSPRVVTAPFIYVRLHGRAEGYRGNYGRSALKDWRDWLAAQGRDAYVFFDNTGENTAAIRNALTLKKMAEKGMS